MEDDMTTTTKRTTKAEREAESRAAVTALRADMVRGQTVYVQRSARNVRVIRLFRVEAGGGELSTPRPEGARLVEITADVRRVLGLRETRSGLAIPGGGSNPCFDTVYDLAVSLWPGEGQYALRCEEL